MTVTSHALFAGQSSALHGGLQPRRGQQSVEHRLTKDFSIINSFTWSKLFEDTSLLGPEIAGPVVEHKLGGEDRPLHLTVASVWNLPFGRGKRFGRSIPRFVDLLIGGWELTGQYTIQSGVPIVFGTSSLFSGKVPALPRDQQSLSEWFDTTQFAPFPSKNTDISAYPAWTGIQNLPGYNYQPTATDIQKGLRNGVYQDFANFIRTHPTRWSDVRASRVNEANEDYFSACPGLVGALSGRRRPYR